MRNCFVPNCDAQCRNMIKRMMFLPPKNEELFEKWKEVLPKKRPFKKLDKVCERHFHKDEILTTWSHLINGVRVVLERGKPKLMPNAIPSCNLPKEHEYTKTSYQVRKIINKKQQEPSLTIKRKRKEKICQQIPDIQQDLCKLSRITNDTHEEKQKDEENKQVDAENLITDVDHQKPVEISREEASFDFIYDDVYEVVLPSTMWGIHRDPDRQFIIFSMFDRSTMSASKVLFIGSDLSSKIYIHGHNVVSETLSEVTVEILTNMLNELDVYKICVRFHENGQEKCEILATEESDYCTICTL